MQIGYNNREWSLQEHIFLQHPLFECLGMMSRQITARSWLPNLPVSKVQP